MIASCPDCGSRLLESRRGLNYGLKCSSCSWSVATTYQHPFGRDQQTYTIIITALGSDPSQSLIFLNSHFTHGIVRTRQLFASGEHSFMNGKAREVWEQARRLRAEGIVFRFEPEYPYDLDDPALDRCYSYDWRPV
jgi:hypothetical protein